MARKILVLLVLITALFVSACESGSPTPSATDASDDSGPTETSVDSADLTEEPKDAPPEAPLTEIELAGPIAERDSEISGMAWYDDEILILMPQYPNFTADYAGDGFVFAFDRDVLEAYLAGDSSAAIEPVQIPFSDGGLHESIAGFEGYEAIAIVDDTIYLTIEAKPGDMQGYIVSGTIDLETGIVLDAENITKIAPQADIDNKTEETLIAAGDMLITLYETNGATVNETPAAHVFGIDLAATGEISFPNIEYRITDATALDDDGRFWVINYFFPGDDDLLPDTDPLAEMYGEGETHAMYDQVERLVQFQYSTDGITMTDASPLQIRLIDSETARNLEGLVVWDDIGFLIVTDKWPQTILAFLPFP